MTKLDVLNKINVYDEDPGNSGGHKVGHLIDITYNQLVDILGEPTINKPSGDNKTQVEWILDFDNDLGPELFTIYDWKTYSEYETKNTLNFWSIGGTDSGIASELEEYINKLKDEIKLPF